MGLGSGDLGSKLRFGAHVSVLGSSESNVQGSSIAYWQGRGGELGGPYNSNKALRCVRQGLFRFLHYWNWTSKCACMSVRQLKPHA